MAVCNLRSCGYLIFSLCFITLLRLQKCRPRFISEVLPNSLKGKEGIIFSNIQDIDAFHRLQLLPQLRERATDTDEAAKVFIEFVSAAVTFTLESHNLIGIMLCGYRLVHPQKIETSCFSMGAKVEFNPCVRVRENL